MSEEEFICKECGEEWESEPKSFYLSDVCANCGAIETGAKVTKE